MKIRIEFDFVSEDSGQHYGPFQYWTFVDPHELFITTAPLMKSIPGYKLEILDVSPWDTPLYREVD